MGDIYEDIGRRIRELRQQYLKGPLSQEALATHLKVPANTLSRWETGTYKPTAENLDQLARFFEVPITIFFPDQKIDESRIAAITSATGGLNEKDFEEVLRYAEFRKVRNALKHAKSKQTRLK